MMEPAIVSGVAAVMGSLVGGSATIATAWITQKTLSRRELMGAEIRKRELLYTEFIAECSRLAIDAYAHTLERPETVLPAYALLNRIRLTSSEDVLAAADQTARRITEQYLARNMTLEKLRELARAASADPLKAFSAACRNELKSLRNRA
jgi:hypothetical protein